jgi:hypothetical protein
MFFILPLWFLCLVLAVVSLFFKKYRFLAPHVALCSTGALVGCFVFSTSVLFGVTKVDRPNSPVLGIAFLIALVVAALLGACGGSAMGFFIARWFNRKIGWKHSGGTPT